MPYAPQGVTVEPNAQTVVVTITEAGGGTPLVYTDRSAQTTITMPATITGRTTFYLTDNTTFTVSCKVGGLENANGNGGTAQVDLTGGGFASVGVSVPVETPGVTSGTYPQPDVLVAHPTGTAATDTANLQAALTNVPSGGLVQLQNSPLGTRYKLNAALTVTKPMTIRGMGVSATAGSTASGGNPSNPSGLTGTVIEQTAVGVDGIDITAPGVTVNLYDFGVLFTAGLASTGHGVNATSTTVYTGQPDLGLLNYTWDNVQVFGHDGNHYGFVRTNCLGGTTRNLRAYGGGGFLTECNHATFNTGNDVNLHPFNALINAGSAGGFVHKSRTTGAATGTLNLIVYVRPQCEVGNAAATAGTQYMWDDAAGAGIPQHIQAVAPDLESTSNPMRRGAGTEFWGGLFLGGTGKPDGTNVAFGPGALAANPSSTNLTAFGYNAAGNVTTGGSLTAFGASALAAVTTGSTATAVGASALTSLTTGSGHTAVGYQAGQAITGGGYCTFVGYQAGAGGNTGASESVAVGAVATVSNKGIAVGYGTTATADGSIAIGHDSAGTSASSTTTDVAAIGTALTKIKVSNNTTGAGSAALGANCPATTATAPYTWFRMVSGDGSVVFVPAWK